MNPAFYHRWTAEEDARLRELWAEGVPTTEISKELRHCRNHIYIRAQRIGLPKRQRGGPRGFVWPKELDDRLRKLWAEGMGAEAIGLELGYGKDRVWSRARAIGLKSRSKQTRRLARTVEIPCLRCRKPFPSVDRRANRICVICKQHESFSHTSAEIYEVRI